MTGTLGRCHASIFFILTYIIVPEKLSDTYFLLSTPKWGFWRRKPSPKIGVLSTDLIVSHIRVVLSQWNQLKKFAHNERWKNRFLKSFRKIFMGVNYPKINFHYTKKFQTEVNLGQKIWKNICCSR